jgi:polysaccharide biosynthesis protein PslH
MLWSLPAWDTTSMSEPPRILLAVPFSPRFDSPHGGRVTAQLLRSLLREHRVALVHLRRPGEPSADPELAAACELVREVEHSRGRAPDAWRHRLRVLSSPLTGRSTAVATGFVRGLPDLPAATARHFGADVIHVEHDALAYCGPRIRGAAPATILVCQDPGLVTSEHLAALTSGHQRFAHRLEVRIWRRYWLRSLPSFGAVVTYTDADGDAVRAAVPRVRVETIGLGIEMPPQPLSATGTDASVAFVGGYSHIPNADAALRLIGSIMPAVRAEHPQTRLVLVGDAPTPEMQRAAGPLDEITGRVASVVPYVDAAAVIALPIRIGGGMRVKLLEALAAGKAIVASPTAVAGLALRDGEHVLLAERDTEFVSAVRSLLRDPVRRAEIATAARGWAEAHLAWRSRVAVYDELYASLLDGRELRRSEHHLARAASGEVDGDG